MDLNSGETSVVGEGVFAVLRIAAVPFLDKAGSKFHVVFDKVRPKEEIVQLLARGYDGVYWTKLFRFFNR